MLLPVLNTSLHVRNGTESTKLTVEGPLTWRQFHRMAGVTTKGNTDDGCEPLPIPSLMVGYEREWLSVSPLSLHFWDSLNLEPWAASRDVAYLVLAPDNDNVLDEVRLFLSALTNGYEVSWLQLSMIQHSEGIAWGLGCPIPITSRFMKQTFLGLECKLVLLSSCCRIAEFNPSSSFIIVL